MSAPCPHRPPCTACPRFGEPGLALAAHDTLERLAHAHSLTGVDLVDGPLQGFRLRARLAIRGRQRSPKLGIFEGGTHRVVHIPRCVIQHPLINLSADTVRRALIDSGTPCYSDGAHLGIARYLQVVIERRSQTAQLVLVANSPVDEPPARLLDGIRDRMGRALHSLWFNSNETTGNTILGPQFVHWHGPETLVESFGGGAVHYGPGAFGQSNLWMAEQIIGHLREALPERAAIAEFYAGVGAIGLSVVEQTRRLHLNEVSAAGLEGLQRGIAGLTPAEQSKIAVFPGTADAMLDAAHGCDVVIADPPRKGLEPALRELLTRSPPALFFYVSCGLESLVHDTEALVGAGALRLRGLTAFNQFPFTAHVETLARFECH